MKKYMQRASAFLLTMAMVFTTAFSNVNLALAAEGDAAAVSTDFAVLSTTDMHGRCWDSNILTDASATNTLLTASTAISAVREELGKENVILVDNGDIFQGTPVSSYSITSATDDFTGETPMALCLKYLDYDALSLGNHEFNYKWGTMAKVYDYLRSDADVDGDGEADPVNVISSNLVYDGTDGVHAADENVFTPYITKDIKVGEQTLKVGILGLENTDCPRWDISDNYPGMRFAHMANEDFNLAKEVDLYVPQMRAEGCEFIIVVYHSGLGTDTGELKFGYNTENQAKRILANCDSEIDMMVLGHDHSNSYSNTKYEDKHGRQVLAVNGGGNDLTKTVFTATLGEDGSIDVAIKNTSNVSLSKQATDTTLKSYITDYAAQATEYVNTACGTLADAGWDTKTAFYLEQTDTMDLINRAQISIGEKYLADKYNSAEGLETVKALKGYTNTSDVTDVDISASSVVVSNNYTARAGSVSIKDIYKFYKYDNNLYILPMTGQQIKDALEFVAENRYAVTVKGTNVSYKTINDYFTCPIFYGLDFYYDMSKPAGSRVIIDKFTNGKAFDLTRTYNLAINNYHLSNGPFADYKPADTIWSQTDDLGGGNIQDLIGEFIGAAGEAGVVPERSNWRLDYTAEIVEEPVEEVKPSEIFDPISEEEIKAVEGAIDIKEAAGKSSGSGTIVGQYICDYANNSHIVEDVVNGQVCGYVVYGSWKGADVKPGDVVSVTGSFTVYSGVPEIKPADNGVTILKSLGSENRIPAQVVTVDQIMNQKNDEYLNLYVVFQNVPASNSSITQNGSTITIYNGASLPEGLKTGDNCDIYGVVSTYSEYQLRISSSSWYVGRAAGSVYDPVDDSVIAAQEAVTIDTIYTAESGSTATIVAQVTEKFGGSAGAVKNNIIVQDVINGNIVGLVVYDKSNIATWNVGDVVKVTGTVGAYGGVAQIVPTAMERLYTAVAFQPQVVTVKEAGTADYRSEFVQINNATLGTYNGNGSTSVTDASGSINIYKGEEYPAGVKAGDVVTLLAVASAYNSNPQLRVGSSFNYISGAASEPVEDPADKTLIRVPVVETSDVHGFLVDVSSGKPDTYQYRLAYISNIVNGLREKSDVLLLDGGDIYQGNPISNLASGAALIAAYDEMKYDAVALGNHEFDWSVTELIDSDATMGKYNYGEGFTADSLIPVLTTNIYYADTKESVNFTKDYVIVEKKGKALDGTEKTVKIAVFGYADDYSKDIMAAKIAPYVIDESKLSEIEATAAAMEAAGTVDASVLLTHAGANATVGSLSEGTVIDLVCGGHTHANAAGEKNGVAYIQPKNQAQAYAYAELCFDAEGNVTVENAATPAVTSNKNALYKTDANVSGANATLDPKLVELTDLAVDKVAPIMNEELGTQTVSITKAGIDGNSSTSIAGTWMCELTNLATGAQVSFTNNGGIRTELLIPDGATERTMTVGDIYTIAPFGNTLPTFTVTYEKLKELLEYVPNSGGLALRMGGATAYYDNTGVTTFFVGDTLCYANGEWKVDKDATLVVSTNEYVATSSGSPFAALTADDKVALVDNEAFIDVLKKEAAGNDGKLFINTEATMIRGTWDGETLPTVHPALKETEPDEPEHVHAVKYVARVRATLTEDGVKGHYACECGMLFRDKAATKERTAESLVIPAVGKVSLAYTKTTYTGKEKKPKVTVCDKNGKAIAKSNYTVTYKNNVRPGKAALTITFKNYYSGQVVKTYTINKASQLMKLNVYTKIYKAKDLQKKSAAFAIYPKYQLGKVTYKSSKTSAVTVSSKGKVVVKKGVKKGTYKITVNAAGTSCYMAKTLTVKVIVK